MVRMKTLFALIALLLCACQETELAQNTELPFMTHPSVLRGDWVANSGDGELFRFSNLEASCVPNELEQCLSYIFTGELNLDGVTRSVSGEGKSVTGAGDKTTVYTLQASQPRVLATFELFVERGGKLWKLGGSYEVEADDLEDGGYTGYLYEVGNNLYSDKDKYLFFALEPITQP